MSYMELALHTDGAEPRYLRVPTLWNDHTKEWMGMIRTETNNRLIVAQGKDSEELQLSFTEALRKFTEEGAEADIDEVFGMFMPAWYWEEAEKVGEESDVSRN